jgi:hypothetical protein
MLLNNLPRIIKDFEDHCAVLRGHGNTSEYDLLFKFSVSKRIQKVNCN